MRGNFMKLKMVLLIVALFFSFTTIKAQKTKKTTKKAVQKTNNQENTYYKEYYITVEIDENSKIKVSVQKDYDTDFIGDKESTEVLENFFSTLAQQKPKERFRAGVILKPHPALKYQEVINVIKKVRKPLPQITIVEVSKGVFAKVPQLSTEADLLKPPKPNPLTLVIELDKNRVLYLNQEKQGTINDLSPMKTRLTQIYNDRLDNGVFREGTNEVDWDIFLKAPLSVTFSDVARLVETLSIPTASSIILLVSDNDVTPIMKVERINQ